MAPSMARTRGGSDGATFSRRSKRPGSRKYSSSFSTVSSGGSSLDSPRLRRKSRRAASVSDSVRHAAGRRVWTSASLPRKRRGRLAPSVASSIRAGFWVVKPSRLAAAMPAGKTAFCRSRPGIGCGPCWAGSARRPSAAAGSTGPCPGAGSRPGGPGGTASAPRP